MTGTSEMLFDALGVDDPQQLLQSLGETIPEDQFIREFTQNGFDAVSAAGYTIRKPGKVAWSAREVPLPGYRGKRLSVWDTGAGMSRAELPERVNKLASSNGGGLNFGIGAKISAFRYSPLGVVYCTLKDGEASLAHFGTSPDGRWGLLPVGPDGASVTEAPLSAFPEEILDAGHGTVVLLLGESVDEDVLELLTATSGGRRRIGCYLNDKYLDVPEHVELADHIPAQVKRHLEPELAHQESVRRVHGLRYHLSQEGHHLEKGTKNLTTSDGKMKVSWWTHPVRTPSTDMYSNRGRLLVAHNGEVYETHTALRLRDFGVKVNAHRVTIIVETATLEGFKVNPQRTGVLKEGNPVALSELGKAFGRKLPEAIQEVMFDGPAQRKSVGVKTEVFRTFAANLLGMLSPATGGTQYGSLRTNLTTAALRSRKSTSLRNRKTQNATGITATGSSGSSAAKGSMESGQALVEGGRHSGKAALPDLEPTIHWSAGETFGEGYADAGMYSVEDQTLVLNEDFPVLKALEQAWKGRNLPEHHEWVTEEVRRFYAEHIISGLIVLAGLSPDDPYLKERTSDKAITAMAVACYSAEALAARNLPRTAE